MTLPDGRACVRAFGAVDRAQVERYNSRRFLSGILRLNMDAQERIKQQVTGNPVVLYMKGTPQFPQCGFSANAVQILKACGVEKLFTVNVLEEPEIRQGIKEYANWPTIPQLYVNGEFVGGSDILHEMYQSGELQKLLTGEKTTS
jgi:monothiol glutaredoxin